MELLILYRGMPWPCPIQAPKLPPIYREAREGDRASVLERSHMDIGLRDEGQATTLIETEETSTYIQRYRYFRR